MTGNTHKKTTPEELWSKQQISSLDVDYNRWNKKRKIIMELEKFHVPLHL